jgi:hypothetical protein
MPCISKADLLKPLDLQVIRHGLPEQFGKDAFVNLRALSSADLIELQRRFGSGVEEHHSFEFAVAMLCYCMVDDDGKRLLETEEEIKGMMGHSHKLIDELAQAAIKLSGIDPDSKKN